MSSWSGKTGGRPGRYRGRRLPSRSPGPPPQRRSGTPWGTGADCWVRQSSARSRRAGAIGLVTTLPGDFILFDIAADGRVLLGRLVESTELLGSFPEEPRQRNLSHFEGNIAIDLSRSGDTLLLTDVALGSGGAYLRKTDGSPPKRLGDIDAIALSPDKSLVLVQDGNEAPGSIARCCSLVPTGPGQPTRLDHRGIDLEFIEEHRSAFFPDGRRILWEGREKGRRPRVWVQEVEGGPPRAVTPEDVRRPVLVGDGRFVCARAADSEWRLYPVDEKGEPRKVAGVLPGEEPISSTPDGLLYVRGADELRAGEGLMTTRVFRLDPLTGRRELWKEIPPAIRRPAARSRRSSSRPTARPASGPTSAIRRSSFWRRG